MGIVKWRERDRLSVKEEEDEKAEGRRCRSNR